MGYSNSLIESSKDYNYFASYKTIYNCPSQTFTLDYTMKTFTKEERETYQKDNYCLRFYFQSLMEIRLISEDIYDFKAKKIIKEDCLNAVILPTSENIATCAFAKYIFKLSDGSSEQFTTCLLMNKKVFDNLKVDQNLEETFTTFRVINGTSITSFEIQFEVKNGKSIKYNSETKILTSTSKGEKISISKLLTIILMVYLL